MNDQPTLSRWIPLTLVSLGLLLSCLLLVSTSLPRSLWVDELVSVRIARQADVSQVLQGVAQLERRPPLYHLALHGWIGLVGDSDIGLRFFSVALALLSLVLVYHVARELAGDRVGILSVCLVGCSPVFILYAPMVRYYSLTLALGLLSVWFFLKLRRGSSLSGWAGYLSSSALLVYTDYSALSLLLAQTVFVLLWPGRQSISRLWWVIGQAGMAFLLLSWSSAIVMQVERGQISADLSGGLLGYGVKLGYPFYSFGLGETLFPWTWLALAGLLLVLALWVLGAIFWLKRAEGLTLALLLSLPLGFTILILSSVATDITFLNVPSRTFFALPYYMLILAGGWWQVRSPHIRLLLLIALAVVWGHGLINLHTGREYHNPIYAVPTREVVAWIRAEARPGDVVLSDPDTGFDYYYERGPQPVPALSTSDTKAALAYLEERHPSRVWLLTFGRDRTREAEPVDLIRWLAERYRVGMEQGYVEQDPTYRRVKERLLHRPAYQYKLVVRRYEGQVP